MNRDAEIVCLQNEKYFFDIMEKQILLLIKRYPFLSLTQIGESVQRRPLYCLRLGKGARKIHVNASHHANEWITSVIVMKSIERFCEFVKQRKIYQGIDTGLLLEKLTYDFVPMVNPDGVELCNRGTQDSTVLKYFQVLNEGKLDFSRWKANARGVDLNRNYNAGFKAYAAISEQGKPSYAYYQGPFPESEPESKALTELTRKRRYDMVFAYHTQGEVIYWTYKDNPVQYAEQYAKIFSKVSGYALDEPEPQAASGGYKDWFILDFKKPGYTIECGLGENPIDVSQLGTILEKTFPILLLASKDLREEE